jgi:hypothetical protein
MKLKSYLFLAILLFCSCKKQNPAFEKLSIIEGRWSMKFESGEVFEEWKRVNDTLFEGKSYEVSDSDTNLSESVKLINATTGIYYIPLVPDQNNSEPVSFLLTASDKNKFVFENPEHDFPSTIIYEFVNATRLKATVFGKVNGSERSLDFDYIKQ